MKEIDKIMELLGVKTAKELAKRLGIAESNFTNWKKRGHVPAPVLRGWAKEYGKPLEWFKGEETEKPLEDELKRLVDKVTDELIAEARLSGKELDLIEDYIAFRRDWKKKQQP